VVTLTVLHLNDVYEITPIAGGQHGGLARVATVRRELLAQNPHTLTVLAGDLFNPSAMGTAVVDGAPLRGRQIVDVMNAAGLDYATFGNHEFDLPEAAFLQRLAESTATWVSSNTTDAQGRPFPGVPPHAVFTVTNPAGRTARVGLFGLTTPDNPADYVRYADPLAQAHAQVTALRGQVDILIAVTHLPLAEDVLLVEALPEIDLVVGGHEHEHVLVWRGPRPTPIAKADANARTVYVHDITFNAATGAVVIASRLQPVTPEIPEDPAVAARVREWATQAFAAFRAQGFEPTRVVATAAEPLDGTADTVRHRATRLTDLIARGMRQSVPGAEWAVYNAGAIRLDDVLPPGPVTEYDVLRTLPFGGSVLAVDLPGALLRQVLDQGAVNRGTGGFLHTYPGSDHPIEPERIYLVALNDFLLTGDEVGLAFLTRDHPALRVRPDVPLVDIRQALISALRHQGPGSAQ
jgi:5'-nucleotidase